MSRKPWLIPVCLAALAACDTDRSENVETIAAAPFDSAVAGITGDTLEDTIPGPGETDERLTATMRDASGQELGTVTLLETSAGIFVSGPLRNLPPGIHAIHIHETGRCEPSFAAAGGHWNPADREHGSENPAGAHFGDLPNITVDPQGTVTMSARSPGGEFDDLLDEDGAALVVHAGADDYRTNPAGDSGDRIACGVIQGR